jgi:pimeloyl-ACP methyl ester carboxylesterase
MSDKSIISKTPGNTPLRKYPEDYFPKGYGYWFKISEGLDADKKLFFHDKTYGDGTPKSTIVFVHGNPECSYTYRKVIKNIVSSTQEPIRIVAMDHIGFGLSDQATYEMVCMDHANNLLQLIEYLDLKNVTLIIHDWGGPIGVGAFIKAYERLSNLIILNTSVFPFPNTGINYQNFPIFFGWFRASKLIFPWLWGAFAAYVVFHKPTIPLKLLLVMFPSMLHIKADVLRKKKRAAQRVFRDQFNSKPNVRSSKRLVHQTALFAHGNIYNEPKLGKRDTTPFYRFIQENISAKWGPDGKNIGVRAVCGIWDPLAKQDVIKQWIDHLPQLKGNVKIFDKFGHFIEETKPKEIAEAIMEVGGLI